ncbi:hypothetical protein [Microviridae sp.]|nr:hypothetical protein [Microviridae sp.]
MNTLRAISENLLTGLSTHRPTLHNYHLSLQINYMRAFRSTIYIKGYIVLPPSALAAGSTAAA